jgi:hypothetical protein
LAAQASTLVERIVAKDMDNAACHAERAAASSGKLSAERCRSLAAELMALGDLHPITDAWNIGERYMGLDVLQMLARSSPLHAGAYLNAAIDTGPLARIQPPVAYLLIPIPYEQTMREINHFHDSAMAAIELSNYPQRAAMMRLWTQRVNEATKRGPILILTTPDWAVALLMPELERTMERAEIARMERRLTQVALALAAFKADHGSYPTLLDELTPRDLPVIPIDLFSEKPLIYERNTDGYKLRSVGPNMQDDQGRRGKLWDDITADVP